MFNLQMPGAGLGCYEDAHRGIGMPVKVAHESPQYVVRQAVEQVRL